MHNAAECYQQLWGGGEGGDCRRVFRICTSSSIHVRITECCTPNRHWKTEGAPLFRFVFQFAGLKLWSELYGKASILVRIAGCWYSLYILLSSHNPKTNWCLSRFMEYGLAKKIAAWAHANRDPNKQEDWIRFCMKRLRTLKSYKIFKSENKKLKTYSGWCPFKWLSNDTTLI